MGDALLYEHPAEDDKLMMQRMWFWVVNFANLKRMDFCFFFFSFQ